MRSFHKAGLARCLGVLLLFSAFTGTIAFGQWLEALDNTRAVLTSQNQNTPPVFKVSPNTVAKADTEPTLDKLDVVCFRSVRAFRTTTANQVAPEFGGKKVLKFSIEDPLHILSRAATAEITREVIFSLGLWRRVCTKCGLANAAVVFVGDTTYVDEQLWHIVQSISDYGQFPKGNQSLVGSGGPGPYTLQAIFANIRNNTFVPLAKYVVVEPSDSSIKRLCTADPDRIPAELQGIYEASRCGNQALPKPGTLKIRALNGPTHCEGDPKIIVGCEVGGLSVELNANEFTFAKHETSESIFGKGDVKEDLQIVILHEIGHWAGIAVHLATDRNIMSAYVEDCKCIDQAVVDQLAQPVDLATKTGNVAILHRSATPKQVEGKP